MALSYEQFFGTGSQTLFTFEFDYLSRGHVKASVDGAEVPFSWAGTYTVQLASPAPLDSVVEVRRMTPRTERLVRFTDGSTLVATDMNTSTLQAFFLAQEAFDQGAASMAVTEDGSYSAQTRRVTNVGAPVSGSDAVTKDWALSAANTNLTAAVAAKDASVAARVGSEGARDAANAYRASAANERVMAETARTRAETALAAANVTKGQVDQLKTDVTAIKSATDTLRGQAQTSKEGADAALAAAQTARDVTLGYRNTAEAHKNAAAASAQTASDLAEQFDVRNLLNRSQNLAEVADKDAARGNLGAASTAVATSSANGLMSAGDKTKLDAVKNMANRNVTISTAAPSGGADGDLWFQYV